MTQQRSYWRWSLVVACMMAPAIFFAQRNKYYQLPKSDKPLMLIWGLPAQPEISNYLREAATSAGFIEHWIGGCIMPESWRKRATKHNARTEKKLDNTKPGWREVVVSERHRLRLLFNKADSITQQRELYQAAVEKIWDSIPALPYFSEIKKDTLLLVRLVDLNEITIGKLRSYTHFELNMITGTLTPVVDITAKEPGITPSATAPNNHR